MSGAISPLTIIPKQMDKHNVPIETLEQYLRCFLSYQQDDWADILHFAEFVYNNSIHSSIRVTPFYDYSGYHPRWSVLETTKLPTNPNAEDHLEQLRRIQVELSTHLQHRRIMWIFIYWR